MVQLTESAGWWMGDDNSHGVEISIAGGVRKTQLLSGFVFFFFFFFISCIHCYGTRTRMQR